MSALKKIFKVLKFSSFITVYTNIKPDGGIKHRKLGISTNSASPAKSFTDEDKIAIKAGLDKLGQDIEKAKEEL